MAVHKTAGFKVQPGERMADSVRLSPAGVSIEVPIFVINGSQDGPTLTVTAGIHGSEYPSVEAAARLGRSLEPAAIAGQVVIVPIANPIAFAARSIYISPPDGKNLNRQFPGAAGGTYSQALAHWLFNEIIAPSDYYIDLHGGDMIEALLPFGTYFQSGNDQLDRVAESMARGFGLPYLALNERRAIAGTTHMAAADVGIPALLAEAGGQGRLDEDDVRLLTGGVHRVMGLLEMSKDIPAPTSPPRKFEKWSWQRAEVAGLFYPTVEAGQQVRTGESVGRVADIYGNTLQPVLASMDGVVLFLVTSLAMNVGDPLLAIAA